MELYMSKQEWQLLRFVTLTWSCFQFFDFAWELHDRRTKKNLQNNQAGTADR